jgi:hypothetical protein
MPPAPVSNMLRVAIGLRFDSRGGSDCGNADCDWCQMRQPDDPKNREIRAAEIYGIYPKWAYGGGAGRRAEGAF